MSEIFFYRNDIQGLRGLSVVLVLIYHTKFFIFEKLLFPGGLFGVDIFFVLSGFIITLVINNSLQNKSFSLSEFYIRRFRRILPALFFVIFFFLFFYKFLLPLDLIDYAKSILNLLFTNANYYFYYTSATYGEQKTLLRLLIHTWSLCVEFQFYILFPILYVFCFKYFYKHLNIILLSSLVLSFAFAVWLTYKSPVLSFYISFSRIWEFLAGAFIANLNFNKKKNNSFRFLSFIGVILIVYSIFFFSDKILNPSFFNILPVFGCALIILFPQNDFIRNILSTKFLVCLGNLSYSIYLWHYPILALSRYTDFLSEEDILKKIILILIIFCLSFISYKFIEKPFRDKKLISNKFFKLIIIFFSVFLMFFSYLIIKNKGFPERIKDNARLYQTLYLSAFPEIIGADRESCFYRQNNFCTFNKGGEKGKIFFIGDSHLRNIFSVLKDDLIKLDYEVQVMLNADCWYIPDFNLTYSLTQKKLRYCTSEFQDNVRKILVKENKSIIVFGGRLPRYLSNKPFNNNEGGVESENWPFTFYSIKKNEKISEKIKSSINELSLNNKIVLIYPIPEAGWDIPRKLFNNRNFNDRQTSTFNNAIGTVSYSQYKIRSEDSFKLLNQIGDKNIFRIYPHKITCNNIIKDRCLLYDLNDIYYIDDNHPSLFFSKLIALELINVIYKINNY